MEEAAYVGLYIQRGLTGLPDLVTWGVGIGVGLFALLSLMSGNARLRRWSVLSLLLLLGFWIAGAILGGPGTAPAMGGHPPAKATEAY